jgi:hypothetical protein
MSTVGPQDHEIVYYLLEKPSIPLRWLFVRYRALNSAFFDRKEHAMRMMVRRLVIVAVSATTLLMLSGGLPLSAQEPTSTKSESKVKTKTGRRAFDPTRRVPMYFGQLGLTDEQKESIYAIQAKEMPKIDALEKQVEDLRGQMLRDCEATLTSAQKQLLEQRRTGGSETRSKKSAPAAKPKS